MRGLRSFSIHTRVSVSIVFAITCCGNLLQFTVALSNQNAAFNSIARYSNQSVTSNSTRLAQKQSVHECSVRAPAAQCPRQTAAEVQEFLHAQRRRSVTATAVRLARCHFATEQLVNCSLRAVHGCRRPHAPIPYRRPTLYARALSGCASNDERARAYRVGRQALVSAGRRSLAAVSVSAGWCLSLSRYVAGAVLAFVRRSVVASSGSSVVGAAVVSVASSYRLGSSSHPGRASLGSLLSAVVRQPHGFASHNTTEQSHALDNSGAKNTLAASRPAPNGASHVLIGTAQH